MFFYYVFFFSGYVAASASGATIYYIRYNMSVYYLGLAGIIGTFVSTYVQIAVGYYGDQIKSKYGRRKPLVFVGFFVIVVGIAMLAFPPVQPLPLSSPTATPTMQPSSGGSFAPTMFAPSPAPTVALPASSNLLNGWFIAGSTILQIGATIHSLPQSSWFLETCADGADYLRLTSIPINFGAFIGVLIGVLIPLATGSLVYNLVLYVTVGVFALFLLLRYVPNNTVRAVPKQPEFIPSVRTCVRTKEFRMLLINRYLFSFIYLFSFFYELADFYRLML